MNPKQTIPLAVTLAPVIAAAPGLLVVGGLVALAVWIFSDDEKENPDNLAAEAENTRKQAENPVFRTIPAEIPRKEAEFPDKSAIVVRTAPRVVVPPSVVPAVPIIPAAVPLLVPAAVAQPKIEKQTPLASVKKKFVTKAELAIIFGNGTRALSRTAAVAALKRLGFGKTAAYAALSPDGRFNAWLHRAPDGIITWKN